MSRNTDALSASQRHRGLFVAALAIGVLLAGEARADVLHLEGGRRVVGRIVSRDATAVTIRAYGGDVRVSRAEIVRIEGDEPGRDVAALVREHRRGLRPGDATGALRLADLAREHSLTDAEGELLQLAAAWRPGSEELRARLGEWERSSRRLPASATEVARVRREFGAPCEVLRTRRYVIAHDVAPAAAERAGAALERTWTRLHGLADALSIELRAPRSALPVHLRTGHSHWAPFLDVVGELFDAEDGLRLGPAPVNARDGSRHVEECELVAAIRAAEEPLAVRRAALARAVEELKSFRVTVRAAREADETLWVSRTRQVVDVTGRLLDADRRARAALTTALERTERLLAELPRVHAVAAGAHSSLARGSAWRIARRESVAGERFVSRLERLEASVLARYEKGAALRPDELGELDLRLTGIIDLAVPRRLLLRDRARAAAELRGAAKESLAVGDRVSLTRAAARQLALETRLLGPDAPTWLVQGLAALIETGDGATDAPAHDAPDRDAAAARRTREGLAGLLGGEAFRADFNRAREDALDLLRELVEERPEATGKYLIDVRDGRVAGDDVTAFERRLGPLTEPLAEPRSDD